MNYRTALWILGSITRGVIASESSTPGDPHEIASATPRNDKIVAPNDDLPNSCHCLEKSSTQKTSFANQQAFCF